MTTSSLRPDAEGVVEEPRELANRHAVPHRDRELPDKRAARLLEARAFDLLAANRVRPIADHDRQAVARGGAHAVGHRVDVGVDPGPHILQIDDEHVEACEHVGGRLARVAVEREHRNAPTAILGVRRLDHVVLQVRPEPVLRPEERGQRDVRVVVQPVGGVREAAVDRCRVADEPDAAAGNQAAIDA